MDYGPGDSFNSDGVSSDSNKQGLDGDAFRSDGRPAINQRDYRLASGADIRRNIWSRFMDGAASAGTRDDYSGATDPATTFDTAAREDDRLRSFVNSILSPLDKLRIADNIFPDNWSARGNMQTEYVAYSSSNSGPVSVDLTDHEGNWQMIEWDTSSESAPIEHDFRAGGQIVDWNLDYNESAIRVVRIGDAGNRPKPPTGLRTD